MKKITALSVCMVMVASFVSCGDSDKSSKSSENSKISKSGSDKAAKDFMDFSNKKTGEIFYTSIFPDERIEELKDSGEWEDLINKYNDDMEDSPYKFKVKDVKKGEELINLEYAESYFSDEMDVDVEVTKGYEYIAKVQLTNRDDEKKHTNTRKYCVVEVNDDWKVIPISAEELEKTYAKK